MEIIMSIILGDFRPVNEWKPEDTRSLGFAIYIIDQTTQRKYLNESKCIVRMKCALCTLGTPLVHAITSIVNVVYRIFKLITFVHFWLQKQDENKYDFKARLADAGADMLRIIATPLAIVGLELSALYGLCSRPYDGRKLYATIERATYGRSILAPCFQPEPTSHFFGGDINKIDVF
jgi:hypothetical protein